ncbi:MAG: hypothetical protein ACLUD2_07210, partial [Clostridium sp.]
LPGCMGKAAGKHREGFVMTETKYIYSEATAVCSTRFGFATVLDRSSACTLIVLAYDMRNRKTEKHAGRTDGGKTAFG